MAPDHGEPGHWMGTPCRRCGHPSPFALCFHCRCKAEAADRPRKKSSKRRYWPPMVQQKAAKRANKHKTKWVLPVNRNEPSYRKLLLADPCAYCGDPGGSVDHIIPSSQGGPNALENLTGACRYCNTWKGSRSLLMFLLDLRAA